MTKLNDMTLGELDHAAQANAEKYETRFRNSSKQAFIEGGCWAYEKLTAEGKAPAWCTQEKRIQGMAALHDEFEKLTDRLEVNDEEAALLMFCSDYDKTCVSYRGMMKNLVALVISIMQDNEDLAALLLKSAELFLMFDEMEQEVQS